jgi:uncharacterized protein YjbI with pentapeptide repeats
MNICNHKGCQKKTWKGENSCVFHSSSVKEKKEDLKIALRNILNRHAEWQKSSDREYNDSRKANLSRADLCGIDLRGLNLSDGDLHEADISLSNLRGANLSNINLRGAYLRNSDLSGVDLTGAELRHANFHKATLVEACLKNASLYETDFTDANLKGVNFEGAQFHNAQLKNANFYGANLSGVMNLNLKQLLCLKTLYKSSGLPPKIEKKLRVRSPELFEKDSIIDLTINDKQMNDLPFEDIRIEAQIKLLKNEHVETETIDIFCSKCESSFSKEQMKHESYSYDDGWYTRHSYFCPYCNSIIMEDVEQL